MTTYRYYLFKADDKGNYSGVIRANPEKLTLEWWGRSATEWREDPSLYHDVAGDDSRNTVYVEEAEALEWVEKLRDEPKPT